MLVHQRVIGYEISMMSMFLLHGHCTWYLAISEAFPPQTVTFEHRFRGGTSVEKRLEEGQIFDRESIKGITLW